MPSTTCLRPSCFQQNHLVVLKRAHDYCWYVQYVPECSHKNKKTQHECNHLLQQHVHNGRVDIMDGERAVVFSDPTWIIISSQFILCLMLKHWHKLDSCFITLILGFHNKDLSLLCLMTVDFKFPLRVIHLCLLQDEWVTMSLKTPPFRNYKYNRTVAGDTRSVIIRNVLWFYLYLYSFFSIIFLLILSAALSCFLVEMDF